MVVQPQAGRKSHWKISLVNTIICYIICCMIKHLILTRWRSHYDFSYDLQIRLIDELCTKNVDLYGRWNVSYKYLYYFQLHYKSVQNKIKIFFNIGNPPLLLYDSVT